MLDEQYPVEADAIVADQGDGLPQLVRQFFFVRVDQVDETLFACCFSSSVSPTPKAAPKVHFFGLMAVALHPGKQAGGEDSITQLVALSGTRRNSQPTRPRM